MHSQFLYKKEYFGVGTNENYEKPSKKIVEKPITDTSTIKKSEKVIGKPVIKTPEIKKETSGVIFKVQIAAYQHPENYKYGHLKQFGKPEEIKYPDGITRFTIHKTSVGRQLTRIYFKYLIHHGFR